MKNRYITLWRSLGKDLARYNFLLNQASLDYVEFDGVKYESAVELIEAIDKKLGDQDPTQCGYFTRGY